MPPQELHDDIKDEDELFDIENYVPDTEWTITEATLLIDSFVIENKSLSEVKKYFFSTKNIGEVAKKDLDFLEHAYITKFWSSLPEKAKKFIDDIISECNKQILFQWISVVHGNDKSDEEFLNLFKHANFFDILNTAIKIMEDRIICKFYQKMKKYFRLEFLKATKLEGVLGIYRCLLYCNSKLKRSQVFCDSVNSLWPKFFPDEKLYLKKEVDKVEFEHNLLAKLVKKFNDNDETEYQKFFKDRFQKMFDPIRFEMFEENGETVFEISGRSFIWSEISNDFTEKEKEKKNNSIKIDHIRICAIQEVTLNENLKFPGKNVSIISPRIIVPQMILLNLCGEDAVNTFTSSAKHGTNVGENGQDADDGTAGKSSGNLAICTANISDQKNLKVLLNGGHGSKGQDGGNGANGKDGIGVKFDDVCGFWRKAGAINASITNTLFNGHLVSFLGGFKVFTGPNDTTRYFATSTYRPLQIRVEEQSNWFTKGLSAVTNAITSPVSTTHIIEYYEGTKGLAGGRGGKNGCGGEGGKKGMCNILNQGEEKIDIKIEANDGKNGDDGKPGNNGEYGKDGWDVGYSRKSLEFFKNWGENNNQKFEIEKTNTYSDDTLYNSGLDTGEGSYCYIRIKTRTCARQVLKENEKTADKKKESERKAEAIARKTNSINLNAVQERYEGMCEETTENEQEQEIEEEEQTESQVNRIAETFDIPKEPKYIPKERHEVAIVSEEVLSALNNSDQNEEPWKNLWKATTSVSELKKLLDKCSESTKTSKLRKKLILTMLRHHKRTVNSEFARVVREIIERKRTEMKILDVIRRNRAIKKLQTEVRNCIPFLVPKPDGDEIIDVAAGVLTGNPTYVKVLPQALDRLTSEALNADFYDKYARLFNDMEKLSIEGKAIKDQRNEFMKNHQLNSENKQSINLILEKFLKKDEKVPDFADIQSDVLVLLYSQLYERILANQTLADAFKLWLKAQSDEEIMEKNPNLFNEDASIVSWLTITNDKSTLNKFKNYIKENGTKSAASRLILAWETKVNLRIYNKKELIEDYLPGIKDNVQHLEIDEKTGAFSLLVFDSNIVLTEIKRKENLSSFKKKLKELEAEIKCEKLLPLEFVNPMVWCSNCQRNEEEKLSLEQLDILKPKLLQLLEYIEPNGMILFDQFQLLCLEYPSIGITFVNSIINVFEVDGCHIDFTTVRYILETVFISLENHTIKSKYFFPSMIMSSEQSEWIDEFLIFNCETFMQTSITRKHDLRKRLKKVKDENLKILCSSKLQSQKVTPEDLLEIVDVMKDAYGAYPDLVEVEILKWPTIIKDNQVYIKLNNQNQSFLNSEQRNLALFWCIKLATAKFSIEEIEKVFAILGSQKTMVFDGQLFGRLVQRLCNNEIVAGRKPSPSKIFAYVISQMENYTPFPETIETILSSLLRSDKEMAKELTKKSDSQQYSYEDWITILRKRNENSELLSFVFEKLENSATAGYAEAVKECVLLVMERTYSSAQEYMEAFKSRFKNLNSSDIDIFLIVIVSNVIAKTTCRGYTLRLNQFVAAFCAVKSNIGLLQQLATGEGKSLIVVTVAIVSVLKGNHVNIVTSSPTLAKRDTECLPPVGCLDIYELFGIKASHICIDSPSLRSERYAENHIIYGDLTSFQRDWLLDEFYAMNIVGSRRFDVVIVDEVDSMLLDQGSNMLYLSHEIPDLEVLQSLFVKIWQIINASIKQNVDDKLIYQGIYRNVVPLFAMQYFGNTLGINDDEANKFADFLISKNVITEEGEIIMTDETTLIDILKGTKEFSSSTKTRFTYAYQKVMAEPRLDIPQHLLTYVKRHLNEFISNAKAAFFMEEGVGYQVDLVRSDANLSFQPKIIIIDQGTGVDLPTTQWSNGLHQFLQLKHGIRLTPVSMKAVFTSNVSFLKKFGKLFGFSGTLGAAAEREQLSKMYNLQCLILPSSIPKQFYEEESIVATIKDDDESSHVHQVFKALNEKMKANRSVLVICESIKQVNDLSSKVKKLAKQNLSTNESKAFNNAILYCRDYEKFIYADGTSALPPKTIIYSTNLAGRGTDIKLTEDLRKHGGLHVIVAFLPENLRVEEQAFGRAARCGDEGTAQLIIYANPEEHGKNANTSKLKLKRNAQEIRRIQKITDYYNEKLLVEEKCFEQFTREFKIRKKVIDEYYTDEDLNSLASRDLLDQWALWLDKSGYEKQNDRVVAASGFCSTLAFVTKSDLNLTQPLNIIKYGILETIGKNYDHAKNLFDYISKNFPVYNPEATYYSTFIYVKQTKNFTSDKIQEYKAVTKMFEEARTGFEKRLYGYHNDRAIIEHYREEDKSRVFKTDAFSQQQLEFAQLMNIFIESIDTLLGGRIDSRDFMTELINEEASYQLHQFFTDKDNFNSLPITKTKVKENYDKNGLKEYCKRHGKDFDETKKAIKNLKNRIVDAKALTEAMNPATTDEFWEELKKQNLVKNVIKKLFINTAKFATMNSKLVELIQEYIINENPEPVKKETPQSVETEISKNDKSITSESFKNQVFQYSMVLQPEWKELKLGDFEKNVRKDCIQVLMEIEAIQYTESAELIPKNNAEISKILFKNYSLVSKNDFLLYGIPEQEIDGILEVLIKNKMIKLMKKGFFGLSEIPGEEKKKKKKNEEDKGKDNDNKVEHDSDLQAKIEMIKTNAIMDGITDNNFEPNKTLMVESFENDKDSIKEIILPTENELPKLPQCFEGIVLDILKQKFAYSIAFRELHDKFKNKEQLIIHLPTFKEASPVFDLMDIGIFERYNINLNGLKENSKKLNDLKKLYNCFMDNEESSNVSLGAEEVAKQCRINIVKSWDIVPKEKGFFEKVDDVIDGIVGDAKPEKPIPYEEITNDAAKLQFQNAFTHRAPANQRIETLDAELISLWKKLDECNLIELRSTSLMVSHGSTHVISLIEKKWSLKTIGKLVLVTIGAAVQLVIGGGILIFSAGSGVMVANFFISEGISDLIYVIKGACTGYADNYKQHKMMSMLASGILCGVGSFFSWGGQFNSVSHGIFGTAWSNAGTNFVALKGSALIAKATATTVIKECGKQILKRVGSAVLNLAIFTALQQGLKYLIEEGIKIARNKIMENLKKVLNQLESTKTLIKEVILKIGIVKGKNLVHECGSQVLQGNSNSWMNEFCDFVFVKYRHLFMSIGQGMAEGMGHKGNPAAAKINAILKAIPGVFLAINLVTIANSMHTKLADYFQKIELMIKTQFENRQNVTSDNGESESPDEKLILKETNAIFEIWEKQMSEIVDKTLESRIAMPLLTMATAAIQKRLEAMVAKGYDKFKTKMDKEKLLRLKKEYEENKNRGSEKEIAETRKTYESKLLKLQKSTRSPEVYAKIIIEGVKIDQTGASAVANLAKEHLGQDVIINIKNADGDTFSHKTSEDTKNAKVINIDLSKQQHYGSDDTINSSKNSCLYDEIVKQVPQLKAAFADDTVFRHGLANVLQNNTYFRQHIQNGWHSIAIEKGLIGGDRIPITDPSNPKSKAIFRELLQGIKSSTLSEYNETKIKADEITDELLKKLEKKLGINEEISQAAKKLKNELEHKEHANPEELKESQQKVKDALENLNKLVNKAIENADQNQVKYLRTKINEQLDKLNTSTENCLKNQEKYPSVFTCTKLETLHEKRTENARFHEEFQRKSETEQKTQNTQENIAKTLQTAFNIYEPETSNQSSQDKKSGTHTFAVAFIPSDEQTAYIGGNYFNKENKQPLTDEQKQNLINLVKTRHGEELKALGRTKIEWVEPVALPSSNNSLPKSFAYKAPHIEMLFLSLEAKMSSSQPQGSPNYVGIQFQVGKGTCVKCTTILDNKGVPHHIVPGEVQAHVPHHLHFKDVQVGTFHSTSL